MAEKKLTDLKQNSSGNKTLDLKKLIRSKKNPLRKKALFIKEKNKKTPTFYKKENAICEVTDIRGQKKENYIYVKGKNFNPPKFLGNLVKIALVGFLILLFINSLNVYYTGKKLEKEVMAEAFEGYKYIMDAGKSASKIEFVEALKSFSKAENNFSSSLKKLWFINTDNTFYGQRSTLGQAVNALLKSGEYFATAGSYFTEALEEFNKIPLYFVTKNKAENVPAPSLTDALKTGLEKTEKAIAEIAEASEVISYVNEDFLPAEIKNRVEYAKEKITEISDLLNETKKHFPAILTLLGDRYPHRFLILLQNNQEIRPSGGFIGSYVILDINDGYIEKLETYDSYDIDGTYGGLIEPPEELKSFTTNWRFRDSNYSPDFTVSGAKARWFLEKEGGPSVDTVIAINQGLLADLLEITGPIQVGDFGKLDSTNYNLLLSFVIESKMWGAEDPKHILKIFIPEFKKAIFKEENLGKVLSKIYKAIQQKHILMYSSVAEVQDLFDAFGLSGRVHESKENEDYLSVINFSLGGTKSEQFIEENISHHTEINSSGIVTDEIEVKRTHQWTDGIYYKWKKILAAYGIDTMPDYVVDILGRGENKVLTKVYVPAGSTLVESDAEDVLTGYDKDIKKTYFMVKVVAKAGETSTFKIKYKLPFILTEDPLLTYKLFIEKQPGSRGSIFNKTLSVGEGLSVLESYPEEEYADNLVYDRYFSAMVEKE